MYSKEVKSEVLKLINDGKNIKEVSDSYNISLPTLYKWKKEESLKSEVKSEPIKIEDLTIEQVQNKIYALTNEGKVEEALELASQPEFENHPVIQQLKNRMLNNILCEEFTKIYLGDSSLSEINNSNVKEFKKLILIILYYEKNKLPGVLKIIKDAKDKYKEDIEKLSILNKFYARFESTKNTFLDYSMYSSLLGCQLSESLIEAHRANVEFEKPKKIIVNETLKKSKKKAPAKKQRCKVITPIVRTTQTIKSTSTNYSEPEKKVVKNKKVSSIDISKIKIQDVFASEVNEINKYFYVAMNGSQSKKAIESYDKFCILTEKSISDEKALSKFISIARIVNEISTFISIDMDNLEAKKHRYIKPSNY